MFSESGHQPSGLSDEAVRAAERHLASCPECSGKLLQYREVVQKLSNAKVVQTGDRTAACPKEGDVDWQEVAAGLWPELKATQLMMHAALCDHCGPLLRAATSVDEPTAQEEKLLAELRTPSRPEVAAVPGAGARRGWPVLRWLVPAMALLVIGGVFAIRQPTPATFLSSADFSEFAVRTHRQHAQGSLVLDVRSESQQTVNQWFQQKLPFSLALPASLEAAGDASPNHLEGARLVQVGGKTAAFIAYQMQTASGSLPVSLMVTPTSVAVASGGVEVSFKKVSFHYGTVGGYRVVTWSLHGLTYALVSQEGNSTQKSCMVCHSAMKDRDLSQTPPPLLAQGNAGTPILQ
jgi:anti-sigma factor RsiW